MAQLFLIGCTGMVGTALQEFLLQNGHGITVYRRGPGPDAPGRQYCQVIDGNSMRDHDAVYNLAGAGIFDGRWSAARKHELVRSRVVLTEALVAELNAIPEANRPKRLINASAVGVYGTDPQRTFDEDAPVGDDFLATLCRNWEAAAMAFPGEVAVGRLGVVLGKDGGMLGRLIPQFRAGAGGILGDGTQWISWVHMEDCVRALDFLRTSPAGVWNLTSPQPVSQRQFADTLAHALNRPRLLRVPAGVLKIALGEQARFLLEGQRVLPVALKAAGFSFLYPDLSVALAGLLA